MLSGRTIRNITDFYAKVFSLGNVTDIEWKNTTNLEWNDTIDFNTTVFPIRNITDFETTKLLITLSGTENLCEKNETEVTDLHWSNDPLFYIITVLMFYALSIIILMVKYIRRERQEAEFDSYYFEFVTREKFQTAQFMNTQKMCNILKSVQYTKVCDEDDTVFDEGESIAHKPNNETIV